jgi:hypothetical protein
VSDDALFPEPPRLAATSPARLVEPVYAPVRELYSGHPVLSAQVGKTEHVERVAQICRDTAFGVVLTVDSRNSDPVKALGELVAQFRGIAGDTTHLLVDANRYSGKNRITGKHTLSREFVRAQLDAGAQFGLTDSAYIPAWDHGTLEDHLDQTRRLGLPAVTSLALDNNFLAIPREAAYVRDTISAFGVPVGLMIEHTADPFGVGRIVRGVLTVLEADVPILFPRCDLSVIGAVAHGAAGGAIGTSTGLRHIFPIPTKPTGGFRDPRVGVYVPRLHGYHSVDTLGDLAQYEDTRDHLICDCTFCNGLGVERITNEAEAFEHSLRAMGDFADRFLDPRKTPDQLCAAWHAECENAQFRYLDIESVTAARLSPPDFLGAWRSAHPNA